MLSDAFGAGVARAELSAGTSHAAHAAVSAAARKHRAAAATDASVGVGAHRRQRKQQPRFSPRWPRTRSQGSVAIVIGRQRSDLVRITAQGQQPRPGSRW